MSDFKIGDRVRIIDIPADLKDPDYDLKRDKEDSWPMRTGALFRFFLGKTFTVYGFGRYGHIELEVGKNREVRKKFGWSDTIWIEPEFLKRVGHQRLKAASKRKA